MNHRTLYRSADDRVIAGVAGGIADYFDVDPSLVRVLWAISVLFTAGLSFLAYIVMMIVVPEEPDVWSRPSRGQPGADPAEPAGYRATYDPPPSSGPAPGPGWQGAAAPTPAPGVAEGQAAPAAESRPDAEPTPNPQPVDSTQTWTQSDQPTPPRGATPAESPYGPGTRADRRWQRRQERLARHQERWDRRADRWEERRDRWNRGSRGSSAIVWGLLLILVGGLLLLGRMDPTFDLARTWPVLIIGFGLILVVLSLIRGLGED